LICTGSTKASFLVIGERDFGSTGKNTISGRSHKLRFRGIFHPADCDGGHSQNQGSQPKSHDFLQRGETT
jgi:hypothetical protein